MRVNGPATEDRLQVCAVFGGWVHTFGPWPCARPAAVGAVGATYAGIYPQAANFDIADGAGYTGEAPLQVKFGPSAWRAVTGDDNWVRKPDPDAVDYTHLFLTRAATREVRQSEVTVQQVLDGLPSDDRRLHDEICDLVRPSDHEH